VLQEKMKPISVRQIKMMQVKRTCQKLRKLIVLEITNNFENDSSDNWLEHQVLKQYVVFTQEIP